MSTFFELRTLISNKLSDGSLVGPTSGQIDSQINSTIDYYETTEFWFNEAIATLSTVAGDRILGNIPADFKQEIIPNGLVVEDSSVRYPLKKLTPLEFSSLFVSNSTGLPRAYVYRNGQFELWYTPDKIYTVFLFYRKSYPILVGGGDTNDFTDNAARLIEYKTLEDLYRDYRSDPTNAAIYTQLVATELGKIQEESDSRIATGMLTVENIIDHNDYYNANYYF